MRFMLFMIPNQEAYAAGAMPDEQAIAAMMAYNEELTKAGVLLALDGLHPPSKGTRITFAGGKPTVTDGPFAEAKEQMVGYITVDCDSEERAVQIAARWPDARYFAMEVRPVMHTTVADV